MTATRAIILAGGRGTRLAPYSSVLPKPLMPVGDRPILELVLDQLANHGVTDVTLCLGHLADLIEAVITHEREPSRRVRVECVRETTALGTAGPLRLAARPDDTFIVLNGDVLANVDYRELVRQHRMSGSMLTVAARTRCTKIEYGVLRLEAADAPPRVTGFDEKPEIVSLVNMGIYAVEPEALDYLPDDGPFDLPDLVRVLIDAGQPVGAYCHEGMWFDIGRVEDYETAVAAWLAAGGPASPGAGNGDAQGGAPAHANGADGNGHLNGRSAAVSADGVLLPAIPAAATIATTMRDGAVRRTVVRSFSALSVDPPLVMMALAASSELLDDLRATGRCGINLFAADGQHESSASKASTSLALEDASAFIACTVKDIVEGADQLLVLGLVTTCVSDETLPLVYSGSRALAEVR
jgi:dTDP-glucose pyrophosphorylase/flavin reductase (DIM6/NTAB) family NADH-FMN oxidoreductase RutF